MLNFQLLLGDLTNNALFSEFITFSFCSPPFFKQPKWVHSHVSASLSSIVPSLPYSHCDGGNYVSPFPLPIWVQALICVSFAPSLTGGPSLSGFLTSTFHVFLGLFLILSSFPSFQNPLSVISPASASLWTSFNINIHERYINQDTFINVMEKVVIHKG